LLVRATIVAVAEADGTLADKAAAGLVEGGDEVG
jgi:hypothetical protein